MRAVGGIDGAVVEAGEHPRHPLAHRAQALGIGAVRAAGLAGCEVGVAQLVVGAQVLRRAALGLGQLRCEVVRRRRRDRGAGDPGQFLPGLGDALLLQLAIRCAGGARLQRIVDLDQLRLERAQPFATGGGAQCRLVLLDDLVVDQRGAHLAIDIGLLLRRRVAGWQRCPGCTGGCSRHRGAGRRRRGRAR